MSTDFINLCADLKVQGKITDADTLAIRRLVWPDGVLQQHEAEAIFVLNSTCSERSRDWVDFFIEAITHYVVRQVAPVGYVDSVNAAWLMLQIDHDGKIDSLAEVELIAKILETATSAPEALTAYALKQLEVAVITGTGPTRTGGNYTPGTIDAAEVVLLRRILFAQAGAKATIISQDEAELLFRLKDATLGADNAAGWPKFFVQAIGNHLMAHGHYQALSIDTARRLEQTGRVSVGGFMSRMLSFDGAAKVGKLFGRKVEKSASEYQVEVAASAALTDVETTWLKSQLLKDSTLDEIEKSLLAFIVDENGGLPNELTTLQQSA
jgi:hypothetical protein